MYIIALLLFSLFFYYFLFGRRVDDTKFKDVKIIKKGDGFKMQFLRHATALIYIGGKKYLLDPMLGDIATQGAYPLTNNRKKNPMISLPSNLEDILKDLDGVILTHTHPDHFDKAAEKLLNKNLPIFIQKQDKDKLTKIGFKNLIIIDNNLFFDGLEFKSFPVNHAEGFWAKPMGDGKAIFINSGENDILISGDTIYDEKFKNIINKVNPKNILANAGNARFVTGSSITLNKNDLLNLNKDFPKSNIIAVHMDVINHCSLTKKELKNITKGNEKFIIPNEGDVIEL